MTVHVERDGVVTTVTLDRPERRNAVDGPTAQALADAFRAFDADDGAAVAVLHGAGGTFCAGADLKAIGTERGNRVAEDGDGGFGVAFGHAAHVERDVGLQPRELSGKVCDVRAIAVDVLNAREICGFVGTAMEQRDVVTEREQSAHRV